MPEVPCPKCGTLAGPDDLFCRNCGAPIQSSTFTGESSPAPTSLYPGGLPESEFAVNPQPRRSKRGCCLVAGGAGLMLVLLLVVGLLVAVSGHPDGLSSLRIEEVGTQTPYPTRTPYRTATPYRTYTPYRTATLYPTQMTYPTTGPLQPPRNTGLPPLYQSPMYIVGGCRYHIKNQNTDQDSVVIIMNTVKETIAATIYVRAGESYSKSGISTGTYLTYVTTGQNWDQTISRFLTNPIYFRFEEPVKFETCSSGVYGSYQYVDIILSVKAGAGSTIVNVPWNIFPKITP